MTNLILPKRRKLITSSFAAGLAASAPMPALGHNGGPPMATEAEVSRVVEQNRHIDLPWGTLPSDPSLAMFMLAKFAMARVGSSEAAGLRPQDVFATTIYTGNSPSTRTITTGLDISGSGGLVWTKSRSDAIDNVLIDSVRGALQGLLSNTTAASSNLSGTVTGFSSTGYSLGNSSYVNSTSSVTYVSWSFRRAAKFFDIVTWTGTGVARTISHNLEVAPGLILVKRTDGVANWAAYHRSIASSDYLILNNANSAANGPSWWNSTAATSANFTVGTQNTVNASGWNYVAYLFAHDADPSGVVQCGTCEAAGTPTTLGWKPQFLILKQSGGVGNWYMLDSARDITSNYCSANSLAAESSSVASIAVSSTGFTNNLSGGVVQYLAIREPV